jgi:hypothetical protein
MKAGEWIKWSEAHPVINTTDRVQFFALARGGHVKGHVLQLAPGEGFWESASTTYGFDTILLLPTLET